MKKAALIINISTPKTVLKVDKELKILDNMNNYDMWKRNECYMNGVSYIERGIRWVTQLLKKLLKHICSAVK